MKYSIDVHDFSFNKIKNGKRKIAIHLFDKKSQRIKLNDILVLSHFETRERINCTVKGIAFFDNFSDLIDALSPEALGYSNKEEILIRLNRIFSQELQQNLNAVAFFLEPQLEKTNIIERGQMEIKKFKNVLAKLK